MNETGPTSRGEEHLPPGGGRPSRQGKERVVPPGLFQALQDYLRVLLEGVEGIDGVAFPLPFPIFT